MREGEWCDGKEEDGEEKAQENLEAMPNEHPVQACTVIYSLPRRSARHPSSPPIRIEVIFFPPYFYTLHTSLYIALRWILLCVCFIYVCSRQKTKIKKKCRGSIFIRTSKTFWPRLWEQGKNSKNSQLRSVGHCLFVQFTLFLQSFFFLYLRWFFIFLFLGFVCIYHCFLF